MKKAILSSLFLFATSVLLFAQQEQKPVTQFTKAELLAFTDVKSLLSAINKGQDYSKYLVRNFDLTTTITSANGAVAKLSEMGPGGTLTEKQKEMINRYGKPGAVFTIESVVLRESGKKEPVPQSNVSFAIKE